MEREKGKKGHENGFVGKEWVSKDSYENQIFFNNKIWEKNTNTIYHVFNTVFIFFSHILLLKKNLILVRIFTYPFFPNKTIFHVHFFLFSLHFLHFRNLIVGTTTGIILITIFIGGGLTVPLVKWLNIKSNVDHAAYVREV